MVHKSLVLRCANMLTSRSGEQVRNLIMQEAIILMSPSNYPACSGNYVTREYPSGIHLGIREPFSRKFD